MGLHNLWLKLLYLINNQILKYILMLYSGFTCKPTQRIIRNMIDFTLHIFHVIK